MRGRSLIISSIILIFLLIGGILWYLDRQQYESTDNAYLKADMILISPKVQGYIIEMNIDDNQLVKQGDVLLSIDPRDYQARVDQASAQCASLQADITQLEAQKQVQQAKISQAKADVQASQITLNLLLKDLKRFKNLIKQGSASTRSVDKIQMQYRQTLAVLNGLKAHQLAEQAQLQTLDSQINATYARLKSAQAQLRLAKLDLENTRLIAPAEGVIGRRSVQVGQLVRPGLALAYLVETGNVWIEANFKETQIADMQPGQSVEIHVDAYPDQVFYGKVQSFSPATGSEFSILPPENATGNFTKIVRRIPVKIVFDPDQNIDQLKAGFSVVVRVKVR